MLDISQRSDLLKFDPQQVGDYYYRMFRQEMGPVSLVELRELVENETLGPRDKVKRAAWDGFVRARMLPELHEVFDKLTGETELAQVGSTDSSESTNRSRWFRRKKRSEVKSKSGAWGGLDSGLLEAAGDDDIAMSALVTPRRDQIHSGVTEPDVGQDELAGNVVDDKEVRCSPLDAKPDVANGSHDGVDDISETRPQPVFKQPVEDVAVRISRPRISGQVFGVLVLVAASSAAVAFALSLRDSDRIFYEQLVNIQNELLRLRQTDASNDQWADFVDRSTEQGASLIESLERDVGADYPARQSMLFATRDYLKPMLKRARYGPGLDEQEFNLLLQDAYAALTEVR